MWVRAKKILLSLSVMVLFALYAVQKQAQPSGEGSNLAARCLPRRLLLTGRPPRPFSRSCQPHRPILLTCRRSRLLLFLRRASSTMAPTPSGPSPAVLSRARRRHGDHRDDQWRLSGRQLYRYPGRRALGHGRSPGRHFQRATQRRAVYGLPQPSQSLERDQPTRRCRFSSGKRSNLNRLTSISCQGPPTRRKRLSVSRFGPERKRHHDQADTWIPMGMPVTVCIRDEEPANRMWRRSRHGSRTSISASAPTWKPVRSAV